MTNIWKTLGLTASLAAGFGIVGASAYQAALHQNAAVEAAADSSVTTEASSDQHKETTQQLTSSKEEKSALKTDQVLDSTKSNESQNLTVQEVAANSMPAMVAITNTSVQEVQNYFGGYGFGVGNNGQSQTVESVSAGTGVIIGETDESIRIITNAHVVADANELSVAFVDETAASASIIGSDTSHDLAVIEVKKSDLSESTLAAIRVISIGSSESTEIGEQVVAIGNALGYGQSVSTGIISAKDRTIQTQGSSYGDVQENEGLFQTDAAINPGNSGGALLNMKGELIAINSAKYADESVEGMGYAIPVDSAMPIVETLINGNAASSTGGVAATSATEGVALGITGASVTAEYASYYAIPEGVYVRSVASGSVAEQAGIRQGDIITAIDGTKISSIEELKERLSSYKKGDSAKLTLSRSAAMNEQFGQNSTVYQSGSLEVTFQ